MTIDVKKLERQKLGVSKWLNTKKGTLYYVPGFGKTYTAILCIKELIKDPLHNIMILVCSEALVKQWSNTLNNHFTKKELKNIQIYSALSLIKFDTIIETNTLIVDELDKFLGDSYINLLNGNIIHYNNSLGLTGTFYDMKDRQQKIIDYFPVIDEITEEEALKEGYISKFVEFNLPVILKEKNRDEYDRLCDKIDRFYKFFKIEESNKNPYKLAQLCLNGDNNYTNIEYCQSVVRYKPKGTHYLTILNKASSYMTTVSERATFIRNSEEKAKVARNVAVYFENKKSIIFCQSNSLVDHVTFLLNQHTESFAASYHSKLQTRFAPSRKTGKTIKVGKDRLKKWAIEDFTNNKIKSLVCTTSLDAGFDAPSVSLAIIVDRFNNYNQQKQRTARAKRLYELEPNKQAIIVNIYLQHTQDEKWLHVSQSESTHIIKTIKSINEINMK